MVRVVRTPAGIDVAGMRGLSSSDDWIYNLASGGTPAENATEPELEPKKRPGKKSNTLVPRTTSQPTQLGRALPKTEL